MMAINSYALLTAALAYYGTGMLGLFLLRSAAEAVRHNKAFYAGLFVESMAMVAGTAGIISTLAYVSMGEALLATSALGVCYTVVTSLVQPSGESAPPMLARAAIGGYRLLGILCITFTLYQWG